MQFAQFVVSARAKDADTIEVERIAQRLFDELQREPARSRLIEANRPEASSHEVQRAILPAAEALGFKSEHRGLFQNSVRGLRPDFYLPVGETGILLEVERGKTTTNNMDLLDFWKCHLCERANYLFLFVPAELRHNPEMSPKREFESVRRRLSHFFEPRNETNVRALFLYGY